MPVTPRPFAVQLHKQLRIADLHWARMLKMEMDILNAVLKEDVQRFLDHLYYGAPNQPVDPRRRASFERTYFGYTRTHILDAYGRLAKLAQTHVKGGFMLGATQFRALLVKLYPPKYIKRENWKGVVFQDGVDIQEMDSYTLTHLIEQGDVTLAFGTGQVRDDFKAWIGKQLEAGIEPGSLIRTISADHVGMVQAIMIQGLDQAQSLGWVKDQAYEKITGMVAHPDIKDTMSNNLMRITRTSYMQGVNADLKAFGENNEDMIVGYRRIADGRPCLICVSLDGEFIPVGGKFWEHPNGMCVFSPILKTPSEMGLNVPKEIENRAWKLQRRDVLSLRDRFYALSSDEQRKVFGDDRLFDIWRKEKFPLDTIFTRKDGLLGILSAKKVATRLPEIGSVSYPKVVVPDVLVSNSDKLLKTMDPVDRATSGVVAFNELPDGVVKSVTSSGLNRYSPDVDIAKMFTAVTKRNSGLTTGNLKDLSWWQFNPAARSLGLYVRKDESGKLYYLVPKAVFAAVRKKV